MVMILMVMILIVMVIITTITITIIMKLIKKITKKEGVSCSHIDNSLFITIVK
jgi:hypothetical protein